MSDITLLMIAFCAFAPWCVWTCHIIDEILCDWLGWNKAKRNLERIAQEIEQEQQ